MLVIDVVLAKSLRSSQISTSTKVLALMSGSSSLSGIADGMDKLVDRAMDSAALISEEWDRRQAEKKSASRRTGDDWGVPSACACLAEPSAGGLENKKQVDEH